MVQSEALAVAAANGHARSPFAIASTSPENAVLQKLSPILPSRGIDASRVFYEAIRFVVVYQDADYLLMKREGAELHFFRHSDLDPALNYSGAYLRASDIDALSAELAALGLPAVGIPRFEPAEDKPWGMRELALVDPDGNLIRAGRETTVA